MKTFFVLLEAGILDGAILAPACVGLTLQFGVTNYVNFAYGVLLTLGAFIFWTLNTNPWFHLDLIPAGLLAAVLTGAGSAVLGALVYAPFYRRRPQGLFMLVLTFVVAIIMQSVISAIWGGDLYQLNDPFDSYRPYVIGPLTVTPLYVAFICTAGITLLGVFVTLRYTKLGKTMRAVSDDRSLALVCGLAVERTTNITWAITGFLAGIAGEVLALQSHGFDNGLGTSFVYLIFAAVVFGGIGRASGAVVGAVVIGLVFQLSALFVGSALSVVAVFIILVVVMMLRPQGLFGATGRRGFRGA